ncbi:MAG: hypothetical protein L0170_00550 [Acidobacteria bacterium]|nr:hypothetical protein [Acidobacteriota bacterium]
MSRAKYYLPILLILLVLVVSAAPAKDPASPVPNRITVGEFALKVVRLADGDPAARPSLTAEEAVAILRQAGLRFKGSVNDPLTEGERSDFALAVSQGLIQKLEAPPTGFDACASLPSVPQCRSCCDALPGTNNKSCGRACGKAHADLQHASPTEPLP